MGATTRMLASPEAEGLPNACTVPHCIQPMLLTTFGIWYEDALEVRHVIVVRCRARTTGQRLQCSTARSRPAACQGDHLLMQALVRHMPL